VQSLLQYPLQRYLNN